MYCGIIGFPLKKPRSIKIWKKFFKKKKINSRMIPIEVNPKNFSKKIHTLKNDKEFRAAAITMPYKENVYNKIIPGDKFSKISKSVNLILKKGSNLYGYNTDVFGALEEIKKIYKKNILIYGYGGTGKGNFLNLIKMYKKSNYTILSQKKITSKKRNVLFKKRSEISKKLLQNLDLFINCSPRGSDLKKNYLKLSPLKNSDFKSLKQSCVIFDIIYSPKKTKLYFQSKKNNISYTNGLGMNSLQASKSLKIITKFLK